MDVFLAICLLGTVACGVLYLREKVYALAARRLPEDSKFKLAYTWGSAPTIKVAAWGFWLGLAGLVVGAAMLDATM